MTNATVGGTEKPKNSFFTSTPVEIIIILSYTMLSATIPRRCIIIYNVYTSGAKSVCRNLFLKPFSLCFIILSLVYTYYCTQRTQRRDCRAHNRRRASPMIYDLRTYTLSLNSPKDFVYVFRFICTCRGVLL